MADIVRTAQIDQDYATVARLVASGDAGSALGRLESVSGFAGRSPAHSLLHGYLLYVEGELERARHAFERAAKGAQDGASYQTALAYYSAKEAYVAGEYAREALKNGLKLQSRFGTNPYKFGMVGATDSHTSLSTADEDNFFSKAVSTEPSPTRVNHPFVKSDLGAIEGYKLAASGYQGVWATENTRKALFDAMMRKETYATTGPRMLVRFFGGFGFNDDDLRSRTPAFQGYLKGVPMGGDLRPDADNRTPSFMVIALRDPIGANLDRIQIVKGWEDARGETHEQVYDVVWSGDRSPDESGRLPPVGNTVDLEAANYTNTIGASELATIWSDPDFDPAQKAFYYARVLEIPTPTWMVYDRLRLGADLPEEAQLIHQERAYTSPIWYTPR